MNFAEMAALQSNYVVSGPFVIHVLDLPHDVLNVVYVGETKRNAASLEFGLGERWDQVRSTLSHHSLFAVITWYFIILIL